MVSKCTLTPFMSIIILSVIGRQTNAREKIVENYKNGKKFLFKAAKNLDLGFILSQIAPILDKTKINTLDSSFVYLLSLPVPQLTLILGIHAFTAILPSFNGS